MTTVTPTATVIVSPRESFTNSLQCFRRLLECTPTPRRIVYVDGGSPDPIARELAECARDADVALLRTDRMVSPNQARNLALEIARGDDEPAWTAFLDNDAYVEPRWLERLCETGEETGAVVVVPLLCIGTPEQRRIHVAGGHCAVVDDGGTRRYEEDHTLGNEPVRPARDTMTRSPCTLFEFHGVLVRTAPLREVTPLDEELRSLLEHADLGLLLQQRGGRVWFEPAVEIIYMPGDVRRGDGRRYFVTRWSDEWNESTVRHFQRKWGLPADDPTTCENIEFGAWMRARAYLPYRPLVRRWARWRHRYPRSVVDRIAQRDARRWYRKQAAAGGPPRLVHRPTWLESHADA